MLDFTKDDPGQAGCNARWKGLLYSADTRADMARRWSMTVSRVRYSLHRLSNQGLIEKQSHKYQGLKRTLAPLAAGHFEEDSSRVGFRPEGPGELKRGECVKFSQM